MRQNVILKFEAKQTMAAWEYQVGKDKPSDVYLLNHIETAIFKYWGDDVLRQINFDAIFASLSIAKTNVGDAEEILLRRKLELETLKAAVNDYKFS